MIKTKQTSNNHDKSNSFSGGVMRRLSVEEIESIVFNQVGEYPKKLKHIKDPHPMMNAHGLVRINGEYYDWTYVPNEL